jgi:hypothetical protein
VRADFSHRDFPCSCVRSSLTRSWRPSVQLVSSLGSRSFFHGEQHRRWDLPSVFLLLASKALLQRWLFSSFLIARVRWDKVSRFGFHPWLPVRPVVSLSVTPDLSPKINFWPRVCAPDVVLSARQSVLITQLRVDFLLRSVPC